MNELIGTYTGIVKENRDPSKSGRLKVFVPAVYGVNGPNSTQIGLEAIPWALPAGLPGGATANSGGLDILPEIGDQVFVRFLDGEPEKPIWEWGPQTLQQASTFKLRSYNPLSGKPDRAALTRYGHTVELANGSVIITTANGYTIVFEDSLLKLGKLSMRSALGSSVELNDTDRVITVKTPAGQTIELDDQNIAVNVVASQDINFQAGDEVDFQAAKVSVTALNQKITLRSPVGIDLSALGAKLAITPSGFNFTLG